MRSPEELLQAYQEASPAMPLVLYSGEDENFKKAMRLSWPTTEKVKTVIQDKDILLKDGVKSMADGKIYTNRKDYNEHLRARGLVEIGNDYNNAKPRELKGNYNCREALVSATKEVLTKQKYR